MQTSDLFLIASLLSAIYHFTRTVTRLPDQVLLPIFISHALSSIIYTDPFAILVVDPFLYLSLADHQFRPTILARCYRNATIAALFTLPYPYFLGLSIGAFYFHALSHW